MSKSEKEKWQYRIKDRRIQLEIESKKNIRWIIIGIVVVLVIALITN